MKRKALTLTLIVTIFVLTIIVVLFVIKPNPSSFNKPDQNTLFIAGFSPELGSSDVTFGNIVLVNPTSKYFDNLILTAKVDDSELIEPTLRLWLPLNDTFIVSIPIIRISIEPYQNETLYLDLAGLEIPRFSPHVLRIYVSQSTFGDVINGQSFTIPQKNAYLQILGYSSIEHSNDTWHEYYNSTTNRYKFKCDQPNFCQEYYGWHSRTLDSSSYGWAKSFNQLYEHYFNVTVFNNNTFSVENITLFGGQSPNGGGWVVPALSSKILQPNETYVFPVPLTLRGGKTSVDNVNQLSTFFAEYTYASGDLTNNHK
jgi:hypothetical protein